MRQSVALRWSLAAVVLVAGLLGSFATMGAAHPQPPQGPAVIGSAQIVIRFLAPLTAAVTAFLLHPVSGYLDSRPPVRSRALAMLVLAWPVLASAVAAYAASCLWAARQAGLFRSLLDTRALSMAGVDVLVLAAWFALGAMSAAVFPRLVAPLIGVIGYLWLAWLPALGTPWLRHVNGQQSGCCGPDSEPIPALLALGAVTAALLFVVGVVSISAGARRARASVALLCAAVALGAWGVAAALPSRDTFVMAQPRGDVLVCTEGSPPTVCVWPEYADTAKTLQTTMGDASATLAATGLGWNLPGVLSERPQTGEGKLGFNGQGQDQLIANAAFESLLVKEPAVATCWPKGDISVDPVSVARMLIAVHAGAALDAVVVDPATTAEVERWRARPVVAQRAYIDEVIKECRAR